jgi:hypothetical protein
MVALVFSSLTLIPTHNLTIHNHVSRKESYSQLWYQHPVSSNTLHTGDYHTQQKTLGVNRQDFNAMSCILLLVYLSLRCFTKEVLSYAPGGFPSTFAD